MIHLAQSKIRVNPDDQRLKDLTDSAVSVLAIYLRFPSPRVRPEQVLIVNKLREYLESINIHTLAVKNNKE